MNVRPKKFLCGWTKAFNFMLLGAFGLLHMKAKLFLQKISYRRTDRHTHVIRVSTDPLDV